MSDELAVEADRKITAPDAAQYRTDPAYAAEVVRSTGLSQRECAARVGVSHTTLKDWISGRYQWPYTAQYTLECLAALAKQ